MKTTADVTNAYEFGPFRLDEATRVLSRERATVTLWPKSFDLLAVLVKSDGRVLTKDVLLDAVWPDASVEENSLPKAISDIRRALDEGPRDRRYILTVAGHGYRFVAPVRQVTPALAVAPTASAEPFAIAVLPLTDLQATPPESDEHLGIGLADALITRLSRIKSLVVRPTSAILRYAAGPAAPDPCEAGRALGVRAVVCGSIRRSGGHVRAGVQLVDVESGGIRWAETFDEAFTDLFAVEDAIATRVANTVALRRTGDEQRSLARRATIDREAHELYLKGRFLWSQRTASASRSAIACFEQAIARDASYALAYAGLADAYIVLGLQGVVMGGVPPREVLPQAKAAADRALALDDTLAEAHVSVGHIAFFFDFDRAAAERALTRALALNPHYAPAHHTAALVLAGLERPDEALAAIGHARRLDPLSLIINVNIGRVLYHARRYEDALASLQETRGMDPHFAATYHRLGLVLEAIGRCDEAIDAFETVARLSDDGPLALASIAYIHAVAGRTSLAREMLDRLLAHPSGRYLAAPHIAEIYAALHEHNAAFAWLAKGREERASALALLRVNPRFDSLRADPRFADVLPV